MAIRMSVNRLRVYFLILDRDIMDPRNCSDAAILDTVVEMAYLGAERIVG